MEFEFTPKVRELQARLGSFMDAHVYPAEQRFRDEVAANRAKGNAWIPTQVIEELKTRARAAGLWNSRPARSGSSSTSPARPASSSICKTTSALSAGGSIQ